MTRMDFITIGDKTQFKTLTEKDFRKAESLHEQGWTANFWNDFVIEMSRPKEYTE